MSIKFKSNIESEGKIIQSKHRAIKHTDTVQTLEVKVVTKTAAHPEYQTAGSSNYGYTIDGVEGAYLELTPGITYRFDQSDGSNGGTGTGGSAHPLAFYEDAAKTTAYNTQVTTNGSPGSSGAYTQIIPTTSTPPILFYQCTSHALMGSYAKFGTGTVGDTYSINASVNASESNDVDLNLDAGSGTDSAIRLTAGTNINLTRNGAQQVTIASTASGGDTYDLNATQDGNNVDINLTSGSNNDNSVVQLTAGTGITLTRNSAAEVTVASSASGNAGQVTTQINISGSSPTQATDGSRTQFTISSTPASENNLQIYLDGVYQSKDTFSVSGTTVTLSTAPPTGSSLEIIHFIVVNANIFLQTHTTVNNSTTSFNAGGTISSENDTQVYVDGVYQSKSNYSVSGSNVVLSTAPATGAVVEIVNIRATAGDNDSGSVEWQTAIKTSNFTAAASKGYFVNTTSGAITVSLPAGSVGDEIHFTDYASTFDSNAITFSANGSEKIQGYTDNKKCSVENATIRLIYQDATKGWTGNNLVDLSYNATFLVVAGGGSSGGGAYGNANGGGGGGGGGLRSNKSGDTSGGGNAASNESTLTLNVGTVYSITVGAGGTASTGLGDDGDDSAISGTGLTTITSTGGGGGGAEVAGVGQTSGRPGGSGGGGPHGNNTNGGGAGTTNQGYAGANGGNGSGGGGGGAGAAGSAGSGYSAGSGGVGAISTILSTTVATSQSVGEVNSSNVYFSGGGGGGPYYNGGAGTGGLGGGGDGSSSGSNASQAGAANTGGGGAGRNHHTSYGNAGSGGNGGSGVVILRLPTASYSGTTSNLGHSYTDGTETILIFKQSGTLTG